MFQKLDMFSAADGTVSIAFAMNVGGGYIAETGRFVSIWYLTDYLLQ
jgi:hypothetical protein